MRFILTLILSLFCGNFALAQATPTPTLTPRMTPTITRTPKPVPVDAYWCYDFDIDDEVVFTGTVYLGNDFVNPGARGIIVGFNTPRNLVLVDLGGFRVWADEFSGLVKR